MLSSSRISIPAIPGSVSGFVFLARWRRRILQLVLLAVATCGVGCSTFDPDDAPLKFNYSFHWHTNEIPYDETTTRERIGRNIRDGTVGLIDNFFQGAASTGLIVSFTGLFVQKFATMGGDVIGLIDDNEYSEHVFKGVLSRQLLKFGASGKGFVGTISGLHEHTFEAPEPDIFAYIGKDTFHTEVYTRPSAILLLGGILAADFVIRPVGNIVTIFGFRDTGKKIDAYGFDLIETSANIPFL